MKASTVTIQMKANEQYFPVVLFIMVHLQGGSTFWVWMKFLAEGHSSPKKKITPPAQEDK